jgi:hypothetical protein
MTYSYRTYTQQGSWRFANKLSTEPPTVNVGKSRFDLHFIHTNPRKSVTYPEAGFSPMIDCFLIMLLKATQNVACSGWQTPYPQKRQQTLGATLDKTVLAVENCSKPRNIEVSALFRVQKA